MGLHKDFPASPFEVVDPQIRWFPASEDLREKGYERLLPPLVVKLREEIKSLMRAIDNTTNPPTVPQLERIESLKEELNNHQKEMKDIEKIINEINSSNASLPQIILR